MELFTLGYAMDPSEGNSVVSEPVLVGDEVAKEENKGNALWLLFHLLYSAIFIGVCTALSCSSE